MEDEQRIALKFAYDGAPFSGFQRQPDRVTVEGTLVSALMRIGAIESPRECGYRSSSRTDRSVSALGNIISFRTSFRIPELCTALNSEMEDVWAYSAVLVDSSFNPRAALERWYRYYLPRTAQDKRIIRDIASSYVGVHDFSGHSRKDKRNPMREIRSIEIGDSGMFYTLDFRAESFLWNMVRRIVWMINEGSCGRIPLECVGPEPTRRPVRVGLARPEFLVLMDIDCGIGFPIDLRAAKSASASIGRRILDSSMKHVLALEFGKRVVGLQSVKETPL